MTAVIGWGESKKAPLRKRIKRKIKPRKRGPVLRGNPSKDAVALLRLHNRARAKQGLRPLRFNAQLGRAAQAKANEMASTRSMSHTNEDGSSFDKRITRAGYDWLSAGENIGRDFLSAEAVFKAWLASPGHRRNILQRKFDEVGFGEMNEFWAAEFGRR